MRWWVVLVGWGLLLFGAAYATFIALNLPSSRPSYMILEAYAVCLLAAIGLGIAGYLRRLGPIDLGRVVLVIPAAALFGYLSASITFTIATFLLPATFIVISSIALLLASAPVASDGHPESLLSTMRSLFGVSLRARRIQGAVAGVLAALVPFVGLLYTNVYAPTTVPPDVVLSATLSPGGANNGLREILVDVMLKNMSNTQVRLLATALNVTGRKTVSKIDSTESDYEAQIADMENKVKPRTRASEPLPNAHRVAAGRQAIAQDEDQVYALADFVESAVLQPEGESHASQVFWIADGKYDSLAMTTAVSYAREGDVLDAVTVGYRQEGVGDVKNVIHIAESVRKIVGGQQELKEYDDFALLRIGGYTVYNAMPLWRIQPAATPGP
jgi:hypothetical protein